MRRRDARGRRACDFGAVEVVRRVVAAAPEVVALRTKDGSTALHSAAGRGSAEICRRWRRAGGGAEKGRGERERTRVMQRNGTENAEI